MIECKKSKLQNIIKNTSQGKNGASILQPYLKTTLLTTEQKQTLFSLRCRNYNVKSNYKTKYENNMIYRICWDPTFYENEIHTFSCQVLTAGISLNTNVKFEHIFGNLMQQVQAAKYFNELTRKRNLMLDIQCNL